VKSKPRDKALSIGPSQAIAKVDPVIVTIISLAIAVVVMIAGIATGRLAVVCLGLILCIVGFGISRQVTRHSPK